MSKPNLSLYQDNHFDHLKQSNDKLSILIAIYQNMIEKCINIKLAIQSEDIALKGEIISKMLIIIDLGLKANLDLQNGGELAHNLDALYEYWSKLLISINLTGDLALVDELMKLITTIKQSYVELKNGKH